ncbi:putative HIT-like protein [Rhodococcoides trifolii]|uniref:HIT-like protein n=1 Tax=Rhodococcoides trifolii TaxID=908250 RepID=A0A917FTP0_9NOCA|nr:HIT domain-containing protein [Rhodococcus trifolii]GGG04085.1 putative HIT-like protein [Rhodococcus trifolii]
MIDCVFCDRIANEEYDGTDSIDSFGVVWFAPLNPVTPGHTLFVPTAHVESAAEFPTIAGVVMQAASRFVRDDVGPANIITSVGAAATQTVMHLHIHVVPRCADDGLTLPWTGQRR